MDGNKCTRGLKVDVCVCVCVCVCVRACVRVCVCVSVWERDRMYHYTAPSAICNQIYIKQLFNIVFVYFFKGKWLHCNLRAIYGMYPINAAWCRRFVKHLCVIAAYHVAVSVHLRQYLCIVATCVHLCHFVCIVSCGRQCTFVSVSLQRIMWPPVYICVSIFAAYHVAISAHLWICVSYHVTWSVHFGCVCERLLLHSLTVTVNRDDAYTSNTSVSFLMLK